MADTELRTAAEADYADDNILAGTKNVAASGLFSFKLSKIKAYVLGLLAGTSTPGYVLTVDAGGATASFKAAGGGGGGSISIGDGTTTVNPATSLTFTSGATVTDNGSGGAQVAISGGGGGGAPWWLQPPLVANMSLESGVATQLTLTDDADAGLLIDAGAPTSSDNMRGAYRTLTTPSGDWDLKVKLDTVMPVSNYSYWGLYFHDSVGGHIVSFKMDNTGAITNDRFNTLSNFAGSATFGYSASNRPVMWFRLKKVGANVFYYLSAEGKQWVQIASESITAFLANPPDRVGFFFGYNRGSGPNVVGSCPCFLLTGTAV